MKDKQTFYSKKEIQDYVNGLSSLEAVNREINLRFSFYNIKPDKGEEAFWNEIDKLRETLDFLEALAERYEEIVNEEDEEEPCPPEKNSAAMFDYIKEGVGWCTDTYLMDILANGTFIEGEFIKLINKLYDNSMIYSNLYGTVKPGSKEKPPIECLLDRVELLNLLDEVKQYYATHTDKVEEADKGEDCTPTWESVMPIYLESIYQKGREAKIAIEEIMRVAKIADKYIAYIKSKKS